jgi:hypothetical protein
MNIENFLRITGLDVVTVEFATNVRGGYTVSAAIPPGVEFGEVELPNEIVVHVTHDLLEAALHMAMDNLDSAVLDEFDRINDQEEDYI